MAFETKSKKNKTKKKPMFGIPEPTSQFTSTNFIELLHSVAQPDTLAASAVKEYSV